MQTLSVVLQTFPRVLERILASFCSDDGGAFRGYLENKSFASSPLCP